MQIQNHIIVSGPSRSGKTTYVYQKTKHSPYIKFNLSAFNEDDDNNPKSLTMTEQIALHLGRSHVSDHITLVIDEINKPVTVNDKNFQQQQIDKLFTIFDAIAGDSKLPTIETVYWIGTNPKLLNIINNKLLDLTRIYSHSGLKLDHKYITHADSNPVHLKPFDLYTIHTRYTSED